MDIFFLLNGQKYNRIVVQWPENSSEGEMDLVGEILRCHVLNNTGEC